MINIYNRIIILIFSIQLIGCANNLYFFKKNINYYEAIIELKLVNNIYQYNYIKKYIKLNLIYAYYKINKFSLAQSSINSFFLFNYTNQNIDFILYIRGLIYMLYYKNILNINLKIYYYYSNIEYTLIALSSFNKIIFNYPNSNYILNIIKNCIYLKNNIVKYQLAIIKYYYYRNSYVSVFNRIKNILIDFPDTQTTSKVFKYIEINVKK